MRNIYIFSVVLLWILSFKINYLHGASLNYSPANYLEKQLQRTIRQINVEECVLPTIPNGFIKVIKKKTTKKNNFLSVNVTCDNNYILQPPDDYIMSCFNGFWDVDEVPECKRCMKHSEITDIDNTDSQLICPRSLSETSIFRDCGHRIDKSHQPFVINGTISRFAEFPWHVALYKKDQIDSHPIYICGGSIITEKSILTVAHCLSDPYGKIIKTREYYVAAGKFHSNYDSDNETTQKRKVIRTDLHPLYKGEYTNYAWDIAVIFVDEPFEISILVHPVCVDWMSLFEQEHLSPRKYGEIAGWGKSEIDLNSGSLDLRVLKVPFINAEQCNTLVPNTFLRYITPDKFCAGYTNGSSVCDGDSGGGLVFERLQKGQTKYYIRGLVSVGLQNDGRCDDYKYSTYTKVSDYITFIRECIQNKNISTTTVSSVSSTTTNSPIIAETTTESNDRCKTPNYEEAKCISIYDCKIFVTALQNNRPTPEVIKFMQASICGKPNEKKVCCGSTVNNASITYSNPITTRPIPDSKVNHLPKPSVCGRRTQVHQNGSNVVGSLTEILDYPWIVLLEFGSPEHSAGYLCLGSLINERYVLTAAHCAIRTRNSDLGQVFRVRLGDYNLNTEIDCVNLANGTGLLPNGRNCSDPPLDVNIEKIIIHPEYNSRKKINDIAILQLAKKISYTDFIKPICLPVNGEKSLPGKQLVVVNWDKNEIDTSYAVKEKSFVSVVSEEECAEVYSALAHGRVIPDNSNICVLSENVKDNCRSGGNSGSSVMGTLFNSSDMYIEGIISYSGAPCSSNSIPMVATKVASYMDWILAIIEP